jgi:hypothetical protein
MSGALREAGLAGDSPLLGYHEMQIDYFKPKADDSLHQSPQGCLVRQLGAQGRRARTYGHRAVFKSRAKRVPGPTDEGDLIHSGPD